MKALFSALIVLATLSTHAQDLAIEGNKKPKITGQKDLFVREDESLTVTFFDLEVRDRDNLYPFGFTLKLYPGEHYTLSGNMVTPESNFNGELTVPTTVHDGKDESEKYNLKITVRPVNDAPVIKGQNTIATDQGVPLTITAAHLIVEDIDDNYPDGFQVKVVSGSGSNYSVSGNTITPSPTFEGTINIDLYVSDGDLASNTATVALVVHRKNSPPTITGQTSIVIDEDKPITIQFSHLIVSDPDDSYPNGFLMKVNAGNNYSVSGSTITPNENYYGNLSVGVVVSDGKKESNVYPLVITVKPINDLAALTEIETDPLLYKIGEGEEPVTNVAAVFDPDNDSIVSAEIRIKPERYQIASDELIFENTTRIKGTFEIQTGILTLKGIALQSEYTTAIRSIQYNFIAAVESQFNEKTIEFVLNDGRGNGPVTERQIKIADLDIALDIPDAFTPNGDLANDTWKIKPLKQAEELTDAVVRVYTKSGKLVYEGKGFEKEWDGRSNGELLPADTYYYTIDLNLKFSKSMLRGLITLLR
jgi:gliding motility-associated-like protein